MFVLLLSLSLVVPVVCDPLYFSYDVVSTSPHGSNAFTEGLVFDHHNNLLLEATGLTGKSTVSAYPVQTHKTVAQYTNPSSEFGEGLTFLLTQDHGLVLAQLTYRKRVVHFYDDITLRLIDTKKLPPHMVEGWGLTTGIDRSTLIMSDGSGVLYHLKREPSKPAMVIIKTVTVHDCVNKIPEVVGLNELEIVPKFVTHGLTRHVRGTAPWEEDEKAGGIGEYIWANVIGTWCVTVIDPETGEVVAWINLLNIDRGFSQMNSVANGIAYRLTDDSIWVTGKNWKKVYRITLSPLTIPINARSFCRSTWDRYIKRSYYKKKKCSG